MNETIVSFSLKNLGVDPLTLAKFFYQKGIFSHLFIQKLIYFSFLKGLEKNSLFFEERFQAWKHGPVLRSVFERMAYCDSLDTLKKRFAEISPIENQEVTDILEETYQTYRDWEI